MSLSLSLACSPKDPGDTDTDADTVATTEQPPDTGTPTSSGSETDAATEGPVTEGATDTDDTAGTDTGGPEIPAACNQADPAVASAFELDLDGWVVQESDFTVPCKVDSVSTSEGMVTTALTCEVDGMPQATTFRIAEAPEGEVAWEDGQDVQLAVSLASDIVVAQTIILRSADGSELLAVGSSAGFDFQVEKWFAPLIVTVLEVCGDPDEDGDDGLVSGQVNFKIPDGADVSIFGGHRDVLPIDAAESYAIDLPKLEVGWCCHYFVEYRVLLRRVRVGM